MSLYMYYIKKIYSYKVHKCIQSYLITQQRFVSSQHSDYILSILFNTLSMIGVLSIEINFLALK